MYVYILGTFLVLAKIPGLLYLANVDSLSTVVCVLYVCVLCVCCMSVYCVRVCVCYMSCVYCVYCVWSLQDAGCLQENVQGHAKVQRV